MRQTLREKFLRKNQGLINQFVELKMKIDRIPHCSLLAVPLENDLIRIGFRLHAPVGKISAREIDEILLTELSKKTKVGKYALPRQRLHD